MTHPLQTHLSDHGLTQVKFAEMSGFSQNFISQVLAGKRYPSRANAVRLEKSTNGKVPAADFLMFDAERFRAAY
jgi:transcriptional regulator with XRE-family HTH domain